MQKPLSLNEIRSRCAQFVVEWRGSEGDERQEGQSFVRDLLQAFGITDTRAALYEKRANRATTGNQGYIDALVPGLLIIELKSKGRNLGIAEQQALDYMNALTDAEQPRYVLTSDFAKFRLLDMLAPVGKDTIEFSLEELPRNAEALAFLAGYQTRSFGSEQQETASIKAARIMADLFESLEGSGYNDHESSVFLVRTLFALYADDAGMWERDLFTDFVENRTSADGSDLGSQLTLLFQVMNQPLPKRASTLDDTLRRFPYVNGGVFEEPLSIPSFDRAMRQKLLAACAFNWSAISPAIFGSLFQAVKSAEARRELGEHYTTETNILKTLGPLFLDELRQRLEDAHDSVPGLSKLRAELGEIRFLDPACGSGNFIIVAYRELRRIELDILLRLQALGDQSVSSTLLFDRDDLAVRLDNMAGIEIEEWPARIAQTALRLVDHQANMEMQLALGNAPHSLPLDNLSVIHVGNALRVDWSAAVPASPHTYIAGNPPFIGQYTKSADQTADLKHVWGGAYDGYLDYVTGWFKKSIDFFQHVKGGRFAFVSTNSVAQGQPVAALFRPIFEAGWRIRFAHQTFPWSSEAPGMAHVHCVITGFDRHEASAPVLFTYPAGGGEPVPVEATNINGYLLNAPSVYVDKRMKPLSEELPAVFYGSKPVDGGSLILEPDEYKTAIADPTAAKYVRVYVGARELLYNTQRWCLWMDDIEPSDVSGSSFLRDRIESVRSFRLASTKAQTREAAMTPHLFVERRHIDGAYLCIPIHVSEGRHYYPVARLDSSVISSNANFIAPDESGLLFAIISSSMFIAWQQVVGGRIKSDYRFSNTIVWNNLPLPAVEAGLRAQIIEAGQSVLEARAKHPERSLADHYNPLAMDPELLRAHDALDRVVDKAFGATRPLRSNEERQAILFERYQELTE